MVDSAATLTPELEHEHEHEHVPESYICRSHKDEAVRRLSPEEEASERQHAEDFAKTQVKKSDAANTPFYDPSYTKAIHLRRLVLLETLLTEHLEYIGMERELVEAEMRTES